MIRTTEQAGKSESIARTSASNALGYAYTALLVLSNALPGLAVSGPTKGTIMTSNPVFVVTNRKSKSTDSGITSFEPRRGSSMSFGFISTGTDCETGRHRGKALTALPSEEFYQRLSSATKKTIVVFVHGYNCNVNVPYSIAARLERTLELPVVMFSWPSKRNPFTYASDECNAEWSAFQLADVLKELSQRYGNENIILVGHSMGCRMLCWALQQGEVGGKHQAAKYKNIFFCAPDIDSQVFEKNIPLLVKSSTDTTVFASSKDVRLFFSKVLHGNSRLGLLQRSAEKKQAANSVDIVDYTDEDKTVFGHAVPYELIKKRIGGELGGGSSQPAGTDFSFHENCFKQVPNQPSTDNHLRTLSN